MNRGEIRSGVASVCFTHAAAGFTGVAFNLLRVPVSRRRPRFGLLSIAHAQEARLQIGLGVNQELPGDHDFLSLREPRT